MGYAREECARVTTGVSGLVTEAWGQGFMVGGLTIIFFLVLAGLRRRVLLHRLIAAEVLMAAIHGTFIFVDGMAAGWYTSATAVLLYMSYNLHNVINWIKIKPFLDRIGSLIYISSVVLVWPYWIITIWLNFEYNNNLGNDSFSKIRPWEALCREPWWLFTSAYLLFVIQRTYSCGIIMLIRASPKLGVLVVAMGTSVCFIIVDVIVTIVLKTPCEGQNPFWKIALVFKCLADTIFLDDFKSVLDKVAAAVRTRGNFPSLQEQTNFGKLHIGPEHGCPDLTDFGKTDEQHIELATHTPPRSERGGVREWFDAPV